MSATTNGGSVPETDDKVLSALQGRGHVPRSPRTEMVRDLKRRDAPLTSGPACRCVEKQLADELAFSLTTYGRTLPLQFRAP